MGERARVTLKRRRSIRNGRWLLAGLVIGLLLPPAATAAATNFKWSGGALVPNGKTGIEAKNVGTPLWSVGANWEGGVPPSGSVGTLTFAHLTQGCPSQHKETEPTCNFSANDLTNLSATAMFITESGSEERYSIWGNPITLGEGGLTATADPNATAATSTNFELPVLLAAPQTWSISGDAFEGMFNLGGDVTGPSDPLEFSLSNASLNVGSNIEAGPISLTGDGSVYLGNPLGPHFVGVLNGGDGNPVNIGSGVKVFDENTNGVDEDLDNIGALTLADHGALQLGQPSVAGSVLLGVNGGVNLSPTSKVSMLYNSRIHASGPVNLGGAELSLGDSFRIIDGTPTCDVLEEDTLISTTGVLTGTFRGIPDGALVPLTCEGMRIAPEARITYTAHAVIASMVERTTTALDVSNSTPTIGQPVTLTATVSPERHGEGVPSGAVEFLDGSQPIGACSAQSLVPGSSASTASCTVTYPAAGAHSISTTYLGGESYADSTSSPQDVTVTTTPTRRSSKNPTRCRRKHGRARARCLRKAHRHRR